MEAIVTTIGTVVVAALVFLASRLDARDQRKTLLVEAEVLNKLPKDSAAYRLMEEELRVAVTRYRARQQDRWENRLSNRVFTAVVIGAITGGAVLSLNQVFDLGKAHLVVNFVAFTLLFGPLAVQFGVLIGEVSVAIRERRRRKGQGKGKSSTQTCCCRPVSEDDVLGQGSNLE